MAGGKMHKNMCAVEPFSVHAARMDVMVRCNTQLSISKMQNINRRNRL
jgi:hypothetical protein